MMSSTQEPKGFPIVGYETNKYFLLDLDKRTSLEEVKETAFSIGKKYHLGDCLIIHSSYAKQLMTDLKPLQNYNLVYGRRFSWTYQQLALEEINDSGIIGDDIRYIEFRKQEKTSTLRVSPKHEEKGSGKVVAYVKIDGEDEGIKEYLMMLRIGRQVEKLLKEEGLVVRKK